jgi:hypothetical protein
MTCRRWQVEELYEIAEEACLALTSKMSVKCNRWTVSNRAKKTTPSLLSFEKEAAKGWKLS